MTLDKHKKTTIFYLNKNVIYVTIYHSGILLIINNTFVVLVTVNVVTIYVKYNVLDGNASSIDMNFQQTYHRK